jgi:hypothetical protein
VKKIRQKKPVRTLISHLWLWQRQLGILVALPKNSLAFSQAHQILPQGQPINLLSLHWSKHIFLYMKQVTSDGKKKLKKKKTRKENQNLEMHGKR